MTCDDCKPAANSLKRPDLRAQAIDTALACGNERPLFWFLFQTIDRLNRDMERSYKQFVRTVERDHDEMVERAERAESMNTALLILNEKRGKNARDASRTGPVPRDVHDRIVERLNATIESLQRKAPR